MNLKSVSQPLSQAYDAAIYDLDGVCYRGSQPVEHAGESITAAREAGQKALYLTNNASRPAKKIADTLTGFDIPADESEVYTAAMAGAELAQEKLAPGSKIFVIGGEGLREEVVRHGFELVDSADDEPAGVIQGWDPSVDWKIMSEGALAINAGAVFFATNLDSSLPQERGYMLGNGALVKAVEFSTGVAPLATGKPLPKVFHQGAHSIGAERPLAVGDRLNTDIRGAVAAGFDSLHVLTGVSGAIDIALAVPEERPTFLARDLRDLNRAYEAPTLVGTRASIGEHWAEFAGTDLTVSGDLAAASLELYRCVVAAAWAAADAGARRADLADALAPLVVE